MQSGQLFDLLPAREAQSLDAERRAQAKKDVRGQAERHSGARREFRSEGAAVLEAGAAGNARPSSRQLGDWLWNETAAGAAIHALREACLASEDDRLKLIAGNFMVPAARVRSTG